MSALSILYLVLPLPLLFILHDGEEVVVQHRWMLAHKEPIAARFPRLRPLLDHLSGLNTKAFAVAALEELLVVLLVTCHVLVGGAYALQIWSALFMAFAIHLLVHVVQAIVLRGYVPGVVTSLLLLPYAAFGFHSIRLVMGPAELIFCTAAGLLALAVNLRLAHWVGMKVCG